MESSEDGGGRAAIPNVESKGMGLRRKEKRIRKGGEEKQMSGL
jgi:hypothetical protein